MANTITFAYDMDVLASGRVYFMKIRVGQKMKKTNNPLSFILNSWIKKHIEIFFNSEGFQCGASMEICAIIGGSLKWWRSDYAIVEGSVWSPISRTMPSPVITSSKLQVLFYSLLSCLCYFFFVEIVFVLNRVLVLLSYFRGL